MYLLVISIVAVTVLIVAIVDIKGRTPVKLAGGKTCKAICDSATVFCEYGCRGAYLCVKQCIEQGKKCKKSC